MTHIMRLVYYQPIFRKTNFMQSSNVFLNVLPLWVNSLLINVALCIIFVLGNIQFFLTSFPLQLAFLHTLKLTSFSQPTTLYTYPFLVKFVLVTNVFTDDIAVIAFFDKINYYYYYYNYYY